MEIVFDFFGSNQATRFFLPKNGTSNEPFDSQMLYLSKIDPTKKQIYMLFFINNRSSNKSQVLKGVKRKISILNERLVK